MEQDSYGILRKNVHYEVEWPMGRALKSLCHWVQVRCTLEQRHMLTQGGKQGSHTGQDKESGLVMAAVGGHGAMHMGLI